MPSDASRNALWALVQRVGQIIAAEPSAIRRFRGIAIYDSAKDRRVTDLPEFAAAAAALSDSPDVATMYGSHNAHRLAIQFVYNTYARVENAAAIAEAFETTWMAFVAETSQPAWRFVAVANINNFSYNADVADLGHGVSVQGRNFDRLKEEYGWDEGDVSRLSEDWTAGGGASSYILVIVTTLPKSPENFINASDGMAYSLAARALLAMRLLGPGDLYIGRMFLNRPMAFNVGVGGRQSAGWTIWRPGTPYTLTDAQLPAIRTQVDTLVSVEDQLQIGARQIGLALRSFSSIYDRLIYQAEDCVIDAITALEALWKLESELSFRLAFRTASLLGDTEDTRGEIFQTLRTYYRVRSKIVHGSNLSAKEGELVSNYDPLLEIVRRALRAFIHLLANPAEWTVKRISNDPDPILLHAERRQALQRAMGLVRTHP